MTIEELREIFKPQIEAGVEKLFFMLAHNNPKPNEGRLKVERIKETELDSLIPRLSGYTYTGISSNMPRFLK